MLILAALDMASGAATAGRIGLYALVVLLCGAGLIMSCLSLSGTWLVSLATLCLLWMRPDAFPGWWTFGIFIVVCILCEVLEAVASALGVKQRGGSHLAGFAGCVGGFIGMFAGGLIPIPIVGPLIGMLGLSFGAVYLVEFQREKKTEKAARIATGALLARALVIVLKVAATLGMIVTLVVGLIFGIGR